MYSHGVFEAEKTPLKKLDLLAMSVERKKDEMSDREIRKVLFRRPRQRSTAHF